MKERKFLNRFVAGILAFAMILSGNIGAIKTQAAVQSVAPGSVSTSKVKGVGETNTANVSFDLTAIKYSGIVSPSNADTLTYYGIDKNGVFAFYNLDSHGLPTAAYSRGAYYVDGQKIAKLSSTEKNAIKYVIGGVNSSMVIESVGNFANAFKNCTNLLEVYRLPDMYNIKNMFYNCTNLQHIWCAMGCDTPLTDMTGAFYDCTSLRGALMFGSLQSDTTWDSTTFYNTGSELDGNSKWWIQCLGSKDNDDENSLVNMAQKMDDFCSNKENYKINAYNSMYCIGKSATFGSSYSKKIKHIKQLTTISKNDLYDTTSSTVCASIVYGQSISDALDSAVTDSGPVYEGYTCGTVPGLVSVVRKSSYDLQCVVGSGLTGVSNTTVLNAGTYSNAIKSVSDSDLVSGNLTVDSCPLNFCSVALMNNNCAYTGKAITNAVSIVNPYNNEVLTLNKDYTVTYSNNTNIGTAYMTISGMGNYTGSVVKSYNIVDAEAPTATIYSTDTDDGSITQSVTLSAVDNVGVTGYYFGISATPEYTNITSTKNFSVDKTISAAGTYYFYTKDKAGNVSSQQKITCYQTKLSSNGGKITYNNITYNDNVVLVKAAGTTINLPVPEKKGYTFSSWDGYTGAYTVNNNKALSAIYNKDTYSITYNLDGGNASNANTYTIEDEDIHLSAPVKQGYLFIGWTGSNGSTPQTDVVIKAGSTGNRNYTANYTHIYDYNASDDSVTIYDTSKTVQDILYSECANAKKIIFSVEADKITDIDFNRFNKLETITVNSKNEEYATEDGILYDKEKTTLICCPKNHEDNPSINKNCKTIQSGAFKGCVSKNVVLPYSVETVEESAFEDATIRSITIKNPETSLEKNSIPDTIETLIGFRGSSMVSYCQATERESYEILTTIPDNFFKNEVTMKSFDIPNNITGIGENAFENCINLESISLNKVQTIGSYAFNNTKLSELEIPESVQTINSRAFANIPTLETLTFEENGKLTTICSFAFAKTGVIKVSVPESVTLLEKGAFNECSSLKEMTFEGMNTNLCYDEISTVMPKNTVMKCYYKSKSYEYAVEHEYAIALMVGFEKDGTTEYSYDADSQSLLSEVIVGPLLKKIGTGAFRGCNNLTTVSFDSETALKEIGENAFAQSGLTSIDLPKTVTVLGKGVFEKAKSLTSVSFGGVVDILDDTFNGCESLKILNETGQLETIGENAFAGTAIVEFTSGDRLMNFGENAFADSALKTLGVENPNCKFPAGPLVPDGAIIKGYTNSTADIYSQTYLDVCCTSYGKPAYVIQLNTMGGINGDEKIYVVNGKTIPPIVIPEKEDHTFAGYFSSENGGVQYFDAEGNSTKIWNETMNLTLYASWEHDKYTVVYDGNGATAGSMSNDVFDTKTSVSLTKNVYSKTGYSFMGWSADKDASKGTYTDKDMVKDLTSKGKTITLYAVWKPANYFITYHSNSGNGSMDVQTLTLDARQALSANAFTRSGYKFLGWNRDANAEDAEYYDKCSVLNIASAGETIHLYAIWMKDSGQSSNQISFDSNGGKSDAESLTVYEGHSIILPGFETTRDGRIFLGWSTIQGATEAEYKAGDVISDLENNVTLYAVWGTSGDTEYTIVTQTQNVDKTYETTRATAFAAQGTELELNAHDFHVPDGYHINPDSVLKQTVKEGTTFTVILDRDYGKIRYHYNYSGNSNYFESEDSYIWGIKAVLKTKMPERDGYSFKGWAETPDGTSDDSVTKVTIGQEGMDVYAIWEKIKNEVDSNPTPIPVPASTSTPSPLPDPTPVNPEPIRVTVKTVTKGKVVYQVSGKTAVVKKVTSKKLKKVTIQKTVKINGKTYKVSSIAKNAFKGCKKLKTITIKSVSLKKVGKNAIKGINKKATIKVPKKYWKKYKKLFTKKTGFVKTMKVKK